MSEENTTQEPEVKVLYTFYAAGVQFHELRKCIKEVEDGDIINLRPEPENKYDSNAIALKWNDFMVGYVPKKFSAEVSADLEINEDLYCIVEHIEPTAKTWEQLKVSIVEDI